jgi:hypothetical protein
MTTKGSGPTMSAIDPTGELDYDLALALDAEDLAEGGVAAAYERVADRMRTFGVQPAPVKDDLDQAADSYAVTALGRRYAIYGTGVDENPWALATFALFDIVNAQLTNTDVRFYALNGGNDLFGVFLTPLEAERSHAAMRDEPHDWPYLPNMHAPDYGMHG